MWAKIDRIPLTALLGILSRASNQIITVIITLVATRFLSPAEFGLFAAASAFLILGRNLLYTGPFEYLLRSKKYDCETEILLANAAVSSIYSFICVLIGAIIFSHRDNQQILFLLCILIPSIPISSYTAWLEALILREGHLKQYYLCTLTTEVCGGILVIVLFLNNIGISSFVIHLYARTIVITLLYRHYSPQVLFTKPKFEIVKNITTWSYARYGSTVTQFLSNYGSDLLLAGLYTPSSAGLYRASNRIVTSIYDVFNQPMRLIVQTTTSQRFAKGLPSDDRGLFIFSAFACVAWPSLTILALLADELIPFVLGPDWTQAASIVVIFATFRCLTLFDGVFSANLVSYGKQKTLLKFQILTCVFALLAIVTLISFGTIGAAIANMIAGAVLTLLTASQAYKLHVITKKSMVQILFLPFFVTALTLVSSATIINVLKSNHVEAKFLVPAVVITALFAWCLGMWIARRKLSTAINYLK